MELPPALQEEYKKHRWSATPGYEADAGCFQRNHYRSLQPAAKERTVLVPWKRSESGRCPDRAEFDLTMGLAGCRSTSEVAEARLARTG